MRFYLSIFGLLCINFMQAQSKFTLSGYVKEAGSKELLIGVTIFTETKIAGTVSNDFGYYALELPAGTHTVIYTNLDIKVRHKIV